MPRRKMPEASKKIVIISILFVIVLTGLVFAYEKSGKFSTEGAENINSSENYDLEILDNNTKETDNAPKLVITDGFSGNNINSGNNDSEFSKNVEVIAKIGENFLGLEKKDVLYFIGKRLEYKPKTINVPHDYRSVQLAIDNANVGDTIEVLPGEYKENIIMKEGVSVVGAGADKTTLDGNGFGNVVTFKNRITNKTELNGFTIRNSGENLNGILIEDSSPWIHDNIITENEYGIYIKGESKPAIQKNVINFSNKGIQVYNFKAQAEEKESGETDQIAGAGIAINAENIKIGGNTETKPNIIDNLVTDNKIGVDLYNSTAKIEHNNISYNNHYKTYIGPTYGIHLSKSSAEISNNIISDSGICDLCSGIIADEESNGVIISYNDIWNNKNDFICFGECVLEENNISEDPLYVDFINGDFRLSEESSLSGKGEDGTDIGIRHE